MFGRTAATAVTLSLVLAMAGLARANVFSMPSGQANLDMVTVGDPGNAADTRYVTAGVGAVGYTYQMGKFDITAAQYTAFLNAVASAGDPYGLYNWRMVSIGNRPNLNGCGIEQDYSNGRYTYSCAGGSAANWPVNYVSWGDAARFANWLSNGQGAGSTETGSYTLNGAVTDAALMAVTRNPVATYVIPTADEWYKAAFYKGGSTSAGYWTYPTCSDSPPSDTWSQTGTNNANYWGNTDSYRGLSPVGYFAGSPGPYRTFDQGGDLWQWNETSYYDLSDGWCRGLRGGSFSGTVDQMSASRVAGHHLPSPENSDMGFRVALVPDPTSLALLVLGSLGVLARRRAVRVS